jgi:ADP-ribose pyrophosphatase
MLLDGTIRDCCTLAAWGLYKLWKEKQRSGVDGSALASVK